MMVMEEMISALGVGLMVLTESHTGKCMNPWWGQARVAIHGCGLLGWAK
jgi:hypothetical protein